MIVWYFQACSLCLFSVLLAAMCSQVPLEGAPDLLNPPSKCVRRPWEPNDPMCCDEHNTRSVVHAVLQCTEESCTEDSVVGAIDMPNFTVSTSYNDNITERDFAVVFDAGSTSTRVHVYEFYTTNGKITSLKKDHFFQRPYMLSNYVSKLDLLKKDVIDPLMGIVLELVDDLPRKKPTNIVFHATAGMRKAGPNADLIMDDVREALSAYIMDPKWSPYRFQFFGDPKSAVSILTGKDEGIYAWITANFMLGRIGSDSSEALRTVGTMDMGGASVQLVFEVDPVTELESLRKSAKLNDFSEDHPYTEFSYGGKTYFLFQRSIMMGVVEARAIAKKKAIIRALQSYNFHKAQGDDVPRSVLYQRFGCYSWNASEEIKWDSIFSSADFPLDPKISRENLTNVLIGNFGTSYDTCKSHVMDIFSTALNLSEGTISNEQSLQSFLYSEFFPGLSTTSESFVPMALKREFFVFSFFADVLKQIFIDHPLECSVETFSRLTKSCNNTLCDTLRGEERKSCLTAIFDNQNFCLDSTYLYSLLKHGCGLTDETLLYVGHSINGVGICWGLGPAIKMVSS